MTARIRQNNICSTSDQFGVNNVILMAFHSIICFLALPAPPAYDWKHSVKHPAKCKLEALKPGTGRIMAVFREYEYMNAERGSPYC